jgi:hypothetical protein
MTRESVNVMYYRELRNLINRVKSIGLSSSGILFGGVVRDDIIGTHYRKLFIDKQLDFDKYWDYNYDVETNKRLIIPKDIDIFFKSENNSTVFIKEVQKLVQRFNGNVSISTNRNFNHIKYTCNYVFLKHERLHIYLTVGNSLSQSGIRLTLDVDIIKVDSNRNNGIDNFSYINEISRIEPPFYNLDFLSNIFICEKSNSMIITRMSNCTGTPVDDMVFSNKIQFSAKIIEDIINMRTHFVSKMDCFNTEYINCYRILKMIERSYSWNIINIPFRFIDTKDIIEPINDKCCICLDEIIINEENKEEIMKTNEQFLELNTNKKKSNYMHNHCFLNYLRKEQKTRYVDETTKRVECRCPFRNIFNFRECHKEVEYI